MKILPVFLRNNIQSEFYVTNSYSKKLILEQLVCKNPTTFDITKCVVSINGVPFNFIKGGWASPDTFNINGIPNKTMACTVEGTSEIKFLLKIECKKEDEIKFENIEFHLHLSAEADLERTSLTEKSFNLDLAV